MQAGLSHQREQAYCFQRDSLAACIRSGNDEQGKIFTQRYSDRNNGLFVQQRMPSFSDMDPPFFVQDRTAAPHGKRQRTPGEYEVKIGHSPVVSPDFLNILCSIFAQPCQDRLDLFLLFGIKFLQIIVQFYDSHRLDEQG